MSILVTSAAGFGAALAERLKLDTARVAKAAVEACQGGLADVVRTTSAEGLVDQGLYKLSWSAREIPRGGALGNSAPYAPVIEKGRRPNRPGPPIAPIYAWVQRKFRGRTVGEYRVARGIALGLARSTPGSASWRRAAVAHVKSELPAYNAKRFGAVDAKLMHIAFLIRQKIHYRGTRPRNVLGRNIPKLRQRFTVALRRELRRR